MAEEMLLLYEMLDESIEEELLNDDEGDIHLIGAIIPFMRRDLIRNVSFFEVVVPCYSLDEFRGHFRMTRNTFESLSQELAATGSIPHGNRFGRKAIPLQKQVLIFVWFISNLDAMRSVSDRFDVTLSSLERILKRVTEAIVALRREYIKWPRDDEMEVIMQNFELQTLPGFPRIIGVIDGTHIRIKPPVKQPEAYVNRKKFHSFNTQLVCDDNMVFRDVLVGWPGSVHDSRILRNSSLSATATNKFPGDSHLLGDGGYPLKRWLITPFRDNGNLSPRQRKFNQTLSSLRSVVERSIRLLKGRWRKLGLLLELMVHLILASCVLHNYCLLKDDFDDGYFLDGGDDDDDDNYGSNGSGASNNSTPRARDGLRAAEAKRVQLMNIVA
ncbi:putative nuclease HARBI1 [Montipora capricornis]|uniref:putative nuclease HARBI1 n=1 Tax=Montipora capricornis TaxID=246305 RepID=UPI0035F1DD61